MRFNTAARPSPAMVVAAVALSLALAGSAVAGTEAISHSKLTKSKVKSIAKKQAKKVVKQKAPGLSVANAQNATTSANGAAGHGEFNAAGAVRPGALNMDNLVISSAAPYLYCEDQAFKSVVATGGITAGGQAGGVAAISRQQLADLGITPADLGCPAETEWVYATYNGTGGSVGVFTPSPFQSVGH